MPKEKKKKISFKKFHCTNCDGNGYIDKWSGDGREEWLEISDCDYCKGKGYLMLEVKDLRRTSRKKKLKHRTNY